MKQVSGKIKLELAQFRELHSFSQFGSDIDKETKQRLDHGERLMEILKQKQYHPIKVEHQIAIIYAAVNNYLKDIAIEELKQFESELYEFMDVNYPEIGRAIKEKGEIDAELKEKLQKMIIECKKGDKSNKRVKSWQPAIYEISKEE